MCLQQKLSKPNTNFNSVEFLLWTCSVRFVNQFFIIFLKKKIFLEKWEEQLKLSDKMSSGSCELQHKNHPKHQLNQDKKPQSVQDSDQDLLQDLVQDLSQDPFQNLQDHLQDLQDLAQDLLQDGCLPQDV